LFPSSRWECLQTSLALDTDEKRDRISDFITVDILYGYELMTLNINNDIREHEGDEEIFLSDGGNYNFDSIELEYKKINFAIGNYNFSYNLQTNSFAENNIQTQLKVKITEFIGGYGKLEHTNIWLNHTSKHQFFKRDARFSGVYVRDNIVENFVMDKTKYSYKMMLDVIPVQDAFIYFKADFEDSTFPFVIFSNQTNGDDLNFLDSEFNSKKLVASIGIDYIYYDFLIGTHFGAGVSFIDLSDEAEKTVEESGTTDLDTHASMNVQTGLNLGYLKEFKFKYAVLEVGALYNLEYFLEMSQEETEEEVQTANLIYYRSEMLQTFKFTARVSF